MIFRNISLGIYYPGNSLLHRLQARTKMLIIVWMFVFFALANQHVWHFAPYIVAILLIGAGIAISGISFRSIWQKLWLLLILFLIGAVPAIFLNHGDGPQIIIVKFGTFSMPFSLLHQIIYGYALLLLLYILIARLPVPIFYALKQQSWFRGIRIPIILLTILAVLTLLFTLRPPTPYLVLGPLIVTHESVWVVIDVFVLFFVLYTLAMLLTMTTSPIAIIEGMTKLLAPLRRLHLPVDDFALMTLIALRFIPTLLEEAEQLIKAQTARGADIMHGTLRERIQSLTALFIPFVQGALRRAADLATALEARGYEVEGHRTSLHETSFGIWDSLVFFSVVIVTGASLFV